MPTSSDTSDLLDAVYFAATCTNVFAKLDSAKRSIRYTRREFESLSSQPALPPNYRQAYAQMADALRRTEQAIKLAEDEIAPLDEHLSVNSGTKLSSLETPETVAAIRRTIEEINAAEIRFVGHSESVLATLREQDTSGLIDWAMPFEYRFTVLLDPGSARAIYETCGDGEEPLRIPIRFYHNPSEDGSTCNWNMAEGRVGHPLQADHHGYLVHSIIEHTELPWQLIGHIKEIEVCLGFLTTESAWIRPAVSSQAILAPMAQEPK